MMRNAILVCQMVPLAITYLLKTQIFFIISTIFTSSLYYFRRVAIFRHCLNKGEEILVPFFKKCVLGTALKIVINMTKE